MASELTLFLVVLAGLVVSHKDSYFVESRSEPLVLLFAVPLTCCQIHLRLIIVLL